MNELLSNDAVLKLIIYAAVTIVGYFVGKAGKKESDANLLDALRELFNKQETLDILVATIESLPETESIKKIKQNIRDAAEFAGVEDTTLSGLVKEMEVAFKSAGISSNGALDTIIRACAAVKKVRDGSETNGS